MDKISAGELWEGKMLLLNSVYVCFFVILMFRFLFNLFSTVLL